jgi:sugar diacid utilization regulator
VDAVTQLRTVLEAPHIARNVRVLCAAGHDREVGRVVLLEDAHGLVGASSDSIVVLTTAASRDLARYGLVMAVRRAATRSIPAVCLTDFNDQNLPSTAQDLAVHYRISVVAVEPGVDLAQLITAAHGEMVGGAARLLARAGAASETLDRADVETIPIPEVMARVSEQLGLPITARYPENGELGAQVVVDGTEEAWFAAPATGSSTDPVYGLVLSRLAQVAEHQMIAARRASQRPILSRAAVLAELLLTDADNAERLVPRARRLGVPIDGWLTVIRLEFGNLGRLTTGDEVLSHELTLTISSHALEAAGRHGGSWHRAAVGSAAILVRADRTEPKSMVGEVTEVARDVIANIKAKFPDLVMYCGVGGSYQGISGLRTSAAEAGAGATAARAAKQPDRPFAYLGLGFRRMLLQFYALEGSRAMIDHLLESIDRLGPKKSREAIRTLDVCLNHPHSPGRAAAELGLHRNTVAYRVKRLFEFLELDPEDPEQRLMLQLACRVRSL